MSNIDALARKAGELRGKGLRDEEIAEELHLSLETVRWLLARGARGGPPPGAAGKKD